MLTKQTYLLQAQWIKPQANKGQKGFFSVTLADTDNPNMAIDAMIWEPAVIRKVLEQGQQFGHDLLSRDSRVEVVVEATLGFWANKNTIYVLIHQLSTIGMLGLRQQQREAALRTLKEEGLLTRNASLPWPRFPLRIGIIGKQGSDAVHDILNVLHSSPYRFETTIFHTAVQGVGAIPGLLKAFHDVAAHTTPLDVIVMSRGGGNEIDLVAFDNLDVARAGRDDDDGPGEGRRVQGVLEELAHLALVGAAVTRHEKALGDRVDLLGWVDDQDVPALYANALGVFYAPYDEDYGYVTVEAFKAGKPVLTAADSGGVLEFVEDGRNGFVVPPDAPRELAARIDALWRDRSRAQHMGEEGREDVARIGWDQVVARLTGEG